ncbi:hypothetical protein FSP39_010547 [Pinctada imbricata]|uniref:Integrator complex subunit 7 n=1 Tax=Pinctada imbricata TaxID=66713 RepID=A0AA88XWA7_PINIB|nr:hypothetical protein FSP39_010547 [Pinctada imbricata]
MATSMSRISTSYSGISNPFHDVGYGDQEQDANMALTELDKGLRSLKSGTQCESVVRFPRLFERYPFPILINSAFLRLADVFRGGTNLLRWCILRVLQQSEKHLDKILNVEEFVRRIHGVIHSNDCIARALTLRAMGSIANIISEQKNVHHSIVNGLDSHDALEVDAAVYAAGRFSAMSKTFAANICDKIATMIGEIATPVDLKLRLIPILQHMHHDSSTAAKARAVCTELLQNFPAQKFMTLTLNTMTHLAALSLVDVEGQISLLILTIKEDPRKAVKLTALRNLNDLAKKAPHMWKYNFVEELLDFSLASTSYILKTAALLVLTTISGTFAFQLFLNKDVKEEDLSKILKACNMCYQSQHPLVSATATQLYTNVAIACQKSRMPIMTSQNEITEGAQLAIFTQTCLSAPESANNEVDALKTCLGCAVRLVKVFPEVAHYFVKQMIQQVEYASDINKKLLCECLLAIGSEDFSLIDKIIPDLMATFKQLVANIDFESNKETCMYLGTLMFQAAGGEFVPPDIRNLIGQYLTKAHNSWLSYKLARQAMRYGQFPLAADTFHSLSQQVASEHFHFWLMGLYSICAAESCLENLNGDVRKTMMKVSDMLMLYQQGLSSLKASSTVGFAVKFPCDFVSLRITLLQTHSQLVRTCNTFRTCPPPAIATALAMTNGQEISRCGQILSQLTKCMKDYEAVSEKFAGLYQSSFDADPQTLHRILLLQQSCEVMKSAILTVIKSNHARYLQFGAMTSTSKDPLTSAILGVQNSLNTLIQGNSGDALTYKHMDFLCQSVQTLVAATFTYPRYFFQKIQSTKLTLAVSPQQTSAIEPVLVHHQTHLAMKVEGIIHHGARREIYRKVGQVQVTVNSEPVSINQSAIADQKITLSLSNNLSQRVEPHSDYFTSNFLLMFPVPGLHKVYIKADFVDQNDTLWKTGQKVTVAVKSYDDTIHKKMPKPVRTSFGQMPPQS